MTPYKALYGERPNVSYLVTIGAKAFVHITKKKTRKLDPRNFEGIMIDTADPINTESGSGTIKIKASRDVRFVGEGTGNMIRVGTVGGYNNTGPHDDAAPHDDEAQRKERIIYDTIEVLPPPRNEAVSESDSEDAESSESGGDGGDGDEPNIAMNLMMKFHGNPQPKPNPLYLRLCRQRIPFLRSPLSVSENRNQRPMTQHHMFQPRMKPPSSRPPNAKHNHVSYAFKTTTTIWTELAQMEPQSYEEAVNHPVYAKEWIMAIQEEYESLMKNGAWELVELPPGKNLVTCKWVFKAKHDANGNIVRFKARLVARGFSQAYGIDYFETYAPVAKLTTYRIIFALAGLEQWEIHGMDAITAYLLGLLDEENIYGTA